MVKSVYILAKPVPEAAPVWQELAQALLSRNVQVYISNTAPGLPQGPQGCVPFALDTVAATMAQQDTPSDTIAVAIGGDGTFLMTTRLFAPFGIPIAGVNLGRLGFLTEFEPTELPLLLDCLLAEELRTAVRSMMQVTVCEGATETARFLAVNDAVLNRNAMSRMIELEVRYGSQDSWQVRADGLIVATPTGSTAYNLSASGPVVTPGLDVHVINPICPQGFGYRPFVVPAQTPIRLTPVVATEMFLTVDGQEGVALDSGCSIEIRQADVQLQLIPKPNTSFVEILRRKLHWAANNVDKD